MKELTREELENEIEDLKDELKGTKEEFEDFKQEVEDNYKKRPQEEDYETIWDDRR